MLHRKVVASLPIVFVCFWVFGWPSFASFKTQNPLAHRNFQTGSNHLEHRNSGSALAASDLYGLGIRVGLYVQSGGMLLSCCPLNKRFGTGIKLASASNMIAILASRTVPVRNGEISPCEAWLIISLMAMLSIPASVAVFNPHTIIGEGVGIFLICVALVWTNAAELWFWTRLYSDLPSLGTPGLIWFFVDVSVT